SKLEIGTVELSPVPGECAGGGQHGTATAMAPGAGDGGQHGDGSNGSATALAALHAIVQAQGGWTVGGVFAGKLLDLGCGHAGPGSHAGGSIFADPLGESIEAVGHFGNVLTVFETLVQDHVH